MSRMPREGVFACFSSCLLAPSLKQRQQATTSAEAAGLPSKNKRAFGGRTSARDSAHEQSGARAHQYYFGTDQTPLSSHTHLARGLLLGLPCLQSAACEPGTQASINPRPSGARPSDPAYNVEQLQQQLHRHLPWAAVIIMSLQPEGGRGGPSTTLSASAAPAPAQLGGSAEASTVCFTPAFTAHFRVADTDAGDAFIHRLLALHHGAKAFFEHQVHGAIWHARRTGTVPASAQSIDLGGPHGLTMSTQPLIIPGGPSEGELGVVLVIELAFKDAALPLLHNRMRADWCSHGPGEITHMLSADGCTVLHQNKASQVYMGHIWTGLEALLGVSTGHVGGGSSSGLQQGAAAAADVVHISSLRWAPTSSTTASPHAATASPHAAATNWLQRLFALDVVSLEQMMATTSQGEVWR